MERLQYRHELKIEASLFDYMALKSRLDVIMHLDEHCGSDDMYSILRFLNGEKYSVHPH